ncbi:haloacid dehalogenase [Streptococcus pseudoporcinus]|uniref:Haloacid dehalogenase n=1 Tax=Streptococcus pseudoporcinus TaxID=361101 RepID=A0A4U9XQJ1_9STRE|nr:Cof-type HAD-IIB family hydrolase [Streptococcus pseudoporcinus]VTS15292.1 haloacid dehalogenase [Streptococcus pseudoporcinus]
MTKKIIALDLDGTLLHHDNTISDYTKKVLQKVEKKGHQVVISTGRPYRMALDYYLQLQLQTPMITFNGSLTHIPEQKWKYEHNVTLDRKYLLDILKLQTDFQMDFIASEYRKNFYITLNNRDKIDPQLFGVEAITDDMQLIKNKITRNPNALLMQTHHQDKNALAKNMRAFFKDEIEINTWGGPLNILEISPKNINKAYALKYLLNLFNKERKDLIAFGDEQNDTQMLAYAGKGYAMKNANDLLLPYADEQIKWSNEEDGVAKQLEVLFL